MKRIIAAIAAVVALATGTVAAAPAASAAPPPKAPGYLVAADFYYITSWATVSGGGSSGTRTSKYDKGAGTEWHVHARGDASIGVRVVEIQTRDCSVCAVTVLYSSSTGTTGTVDRFQYRDRQGVSKIVTVMFHKSGWFGTRNIVRTI